MTSTTKAATDKAAIPNRNLLFAMNATGWLLFATSIAILISAFFIMMSSSYNRNPGWSHRRPRHCDWGNVDLKYYPECLPEAPVSLSLTDLIQQYWYLAFILLIAGIIIANSSYHTFQHYYRKVHRGKIIAKDTRDTGSALQWILCVKGETLAGETRQSWNPVNAGYWHEVRIGGWYGSRR